MNMGLTAEHEDIVQRTGSEPVQAVNFIIRCKAVVIEGVHSLAAARLLCADCMLKY